VEQVQVACEKCGKELVPEAAYCERCGARTRRARRLVRVAIRVEALIFVLVIALVIAFTWICATQRWVKTSAVFAPRQARPP
jgi:hypothetical protein